MRRIAICFLLILGFLPVAESRGQALKEASSQDLQIVPDEHEPSHIYGSVRRSLETGVPLALYREDYQAQPDTPENMARQYLRDHAAMLGMKPDLNDLVHVATHKTPGGYRVRFEQHLAGYPVYHSGIVVSLDIRNRVLFVVNGYKPRARLRTAPNKTGSVQVRHIARDYLNIQQVPQYESDRPVVYYNKGRTRLVYQVDLVATASVSGNWEILIDAESGEIIKAIDKAHYRKSNLATRSSHETPADAPSVARTTGGTKMRVEGSGWVFDPDPLSSARAAYQAGGEYGDNDDADSPSLSEQLVEVILPEVTQEGNLFHLTGTYAQIDDWDGPFKGTFGQEQNTWHHTRDQDAFEAVNAYYHVDKAMRYVNETLGFAVMPYQYEGGVKVDPHGANGDDQSYYLDSVGGLSFGEGGVDDAEDADVIWHELGHGLHDWLTSGQVSSNGDLGEGIGDYWAASYHRSLGFWTPADEAYQWLFVWDGHNEYWSGRITNYDGHYPEDLFDGLHIDGQMWASSLMEIYDQIGREDMDRLFLETISMTGENTTQQDAAYAMVQADAALFAGAHTEIISEVFKNRGYLQDLQVAFEADVTAGPPALTVTFSDQSFSIDPNQPITAWAWDFDHDGTVDATDQNPTWTFETPGLYTVVLTVTIGTEQQTVMMQDYISVNDGVYVWEGEQGQIDYSGTYLRDYFTDANMQVAYPRRAQLHESLIGYDAVFLSFGQFGSTLTEFDDEMAAVVQDYLEAGGKVFLDGSDALGFDQVFNEPLLGLFGIAEADDGPGSQTPVQNLIGQDGTLAEGMVFTASSQVGTTFIDLFTPSTTGMAAFIEDGYGTVAVQHEGSFGQKTFALGYTFADLTDGNIPSTRANFLVRLMDFFGLQTGEPTAVDEPETLPKRFALLPGYPNPFSRQATLGFSLPDHRVVTLEVYNNLGQKVATLLDNVPQAPGRHEVVFNAPSMASGLYMVRLTAGDLIAQQRILLVK